jgi:hypothetical protein
MDRRVIDMLGKRCHHLTVIAHAGSAIKGDGRSHTAVWRCLCDCGREIIVLGWALRSGHTKSCGCARIAANVRRYREPGVIKKSLDEKLAAGGEPTRADVNRQNYRRK